MPLPGFVSNQHLKLAAWARFGFRIPNHLLYQNTRAPRPLHAESGEGNPTPDKKGRGLGLTSRFFRAASQEMGYRTCRQTFGDQADVVAFLPARASDIRLGVRGEDCFD